ncbi:MAG: hypothetical protein EPN92_03655 [Chitinophagaceae bacterium]|nr:MAG: hypothetical protein EPN92_03655 [Chitinophagaceae bacterium]
MLFSLTMRWLLFLSRVAFICNLFFLVSFSLKVYDWLKPEDIKSTIIIIGWVLSVIFNPFINACYLIVFWIKREKLAVVPAWLMVMNVFFLVLQLIFLVLLNTENNFSG